MERKQRIGLESSATRRRLLDGAEQLMLEEGYAAVTSRRLGVAAGVKPQLVHYYFPTMDALFVALYRRRAESAIENARRELAADRPLQAIWRMSLDRTHVTFIQEFMALANHRKLVRLEMSRFGEELRDLQSAAVRRFLAERKVMIDVNPEQLVMGLAGIGLLLGLEAEAGMHFGHPDMIDYVERKLAALSGDASASSDAGASTG